MKLPPASRKASYTFRASSFAAPQPQSSPKVIVPRAASDTRSPEFPSSLYFILFSLFNCRLNLRCPLTFPSCRQRRRRQRYARLPGRLPLTFARFPLSFLLRFLALFHSVTMPNSLRYFQNIFTIKLIPVKYRYGIATFAIFRGSGRRAAFRTWGRATPCSSTRALPTDSGI